MFFSSDALVLKRTKVSDNDMILTLFTKKAGKMQAIANGARHPKSRFASGAHPFVFGRYNLSTGSNMAKVTSIEVYDSFYHLREDLNRLAYGSWLLELADGITVEGVTNHKLFVALLESIELLIKPEVNPDQIKVAYELKAIDSIGIRPELHSCVSCGVTGDRKWKFSVPEGGLVCEKCAAGYDSLFIIGKTLPKIMQYFLLKDMRIIAKTKIHDSYIEKLDIILNAYLHHHLERHHFKSLEFLNSIRYTNDGK